MPSKGLHLLLTDEAFDTVCRPLGVVGPHGDCIAVTGQATDSQLHVLVVELKSINRLKSEARHGHNLIARPAQDLAKLTQRKDRQLARLHKGSCKAGCRARADNSHSIAGPGPGQVE